MNQQEIYRMSDLCRDASVYHTKLNRLYAFIFGNKDLKHEPRTDLQEKYKESIWFHDLKPMIERLDQRSLRVVSFIMEMAVAGPGSNMSTELMELECDVDDAKCLLSDVPQEIDLKLTRFIIDHRLPSA